MPPVKKLSKPKRPLSGYNLFYRYKRAKVIEAATALKSSSAELTNDEIRAIITCPPGLEGISVDHPIYTTLTQEQIDTLRANNIRTALEGKLFPNENARNRLHRKVHGMGFVEMGKLMRETWSSIDQLAKEV